MKNGKKILMILLASSILLSLVSLNVQSGCASPTRIYVSPPTTTAIYNTDFTVDINIEDVTDLRAWQVRLNWNPQVLAFVDAPAKFSYNQAEGWAFLVSYVGSSFSGSGTLTNITFHGIEVGECFLDIYDNETKLFSSGSGASTPPYWGDATGDYKVNVMDSSAIAKALLTHPGHLRYDPNADFNDDSFVDVFDLLCVPLNWMRTYDPLLPGEGVKPGEIAHDVEDGLAAVSSFIQVEPADLKVVVGERFNVSINILGVLDFYSLQYRVSWNPEAFQVVNLYEGDLMPGRGKSFFVYNVHEEQGQVLVSNTFLGPRPHPVPNVDSGNLSTIEFSAAKAGSFQLNVSDTPFTQKGATVTVEGINTTEVTAYHLNSDHSISRSNVVLASSVLTVGPGEQYSTIQEAVDAANPYDVIHVFNGTYVENVKVNKDNLTLIGESRYSAIIKAKDPEKDVINVTDANNTRIMEFTIQDGEAGVKLLYYSSNTTIKDNIIMGNNVGVGWVGWQTTLSQIKETLLGNNITNNVGCGLFVWNTEQDTIRGNILTANGVGIQKSGPFANSVICLNNIVDNGIQLYPTTIDSTIQWYCTVGTDGINKGNYWSPPDPDANDPYPLSNTWVPLREDIDFDGRVSIVDIVLASSAFGSTWSYDPRWNPQADIDNNNVVNIIDLAKIAKKYGYVDS